MYDFMKLCTIAQILRNLPNQNQKNLFYCEDYHEIKKNIVWFKLKFEIKKIIESSKS